MTAAFCAIGLFCLMLGGIEMTSAAVRNSDIPDNYYRAKSTVVYTDGGRAINSDESGRTDMLNEYIADNFHTEGIVQYPTDMTEEYSVFMATGGYFDIYGLKLEKGGEFTKDEYGSDSAYMPVIMGYGFINDYDIGDIYLDKFTAVGFLQDDQYIPEISGRISKGFSVNYNIYTPIKSRKWLKENGLSYPSDLIFAENKSELDAINQKAGQLGLYTYNFLSADESEKIMLNTISTLNIPLALAAFIIILLSMLCLFQLMNLFINDNLTELSIHMMCGARLYEIIMRVGAGTILTSFLSALITSLIFRSVLTTVMIFLSAFAAVIITLIPTAIKIRRKPLIFLEKREKGG